MPRVCTICVHPQRVAIDKALVAGEPYRGIARQFRVSEDALPRHKADHLPRKLALAKDAQETAQADDLLADLRGLRQRADRLYLVSEGILRRALQAQDLASANAAVRSAISANREARGTLELLAELEGKLERRAQTTIILSPEWPRVYGALLAALQSHPAARIAVAERLHAIGAGDAVGA